MTGPLARQRRAGEIAAETRRKIAHVDHLLHFAMRLRRDLSRFEAHEEREVVLRLPQALADPPHQLAAPRRGYRAKTRERLDALPDHAIRLSSGRPGEPGEPRAVDRGPRLEGRAVPEVRVAARVRGPHGAPPRRGERAARPPGSSQPPPTGHRPRRASATRSYRRTRRTDSARNSSSPMDSCGTKPRPSMRPAAKRSIIVATPAAVVIWIALQFHRRSSD